MVAVKEAFRIPEAAYQLDAPVAPERPALDCIFNIKKISDFTGMERTALYRKFKSLNINSEKN